jgi:hypothetical protein
MVRARPALLAGVAAAVLAAGCGTNDYRYVNNASADAYFKVPNDWEIFRIQAEEVTDRLAPEQGTGPWHVVFDSAADPAADHADAERPTDAVGQALIIDIGPEQGDRLSPADLREAFIGVDPLNVDDDTIEVIDAELLEQGGLRGSRVLFNQQTNDGEWVTIDHSSLINAAGTKVYLFEVKADAVAFKADKDRLAQIVDSFEVRS